MTDTPTNAALEALTTDDVRRLMAVFGRYADFTREDDRRIFDAIQARAALTSAGEFVVVPRVPTAAILDAIIDTHKGALWPIRLWENALAAAATQPREEGFGKIDTRHRYLIKRNADRALIGSTDDLGAHLPAGHILIDTIGEDGLGLGIELYLYLKDHPHAQ